MKFNDTEQIAKILEENSVRPTANRVTVMRLLDRSERPLSLMEMEEILETLDKSSLFRTIVTLSEHGLVHALEDGRGITRYELCTDHSSEDEEHQHTDQHAHFYCEKCGRTLCLHNIPAPKVELSEGYEVHTVNYMIKGICPDCRS